VTAPPEPVNLFEAPVSGIYVSLTERARPQWWVRSLADGDAHLGVYSPPSRSVITLCGTEFVPLATGYPPHLAPLKTLGDPDQACPECKRESR